MSEVKVPPWVDFAFKYWKPIFGLGAVLVSAIVFLATLSPRIQAGEQKNKQQDEAIVDLKGIASRLDGYIQGQQETNQLLRQQQQPQMQTIPNLPYPQPQWRWQQDEDGNWYCQGERESWWPDERGECE